MKKEHFINRFTHMRKCHVCGKWCHLARPVSFGVETEDVCIPCIVKNDLRLGMLKAQSHLRREESLVWWLCMILGVTLGIRFGIEWVFSFL